MSRDFEQMENHLLNVDKRLIRLETMVEITEKRQKQMPTNQGKLQHSNLPSLVNH